MSDNPIQVFFTKRNNYTNLGIAIRAGASLSLIDVEAKNGVCVFCEPNKDPSQTFVHELAHHLGLYHPDVDRLEDTHTFNHILHGDQGHKPNIMHVHPDSNDFSKDQKQVMQGNPMLTDFTGIK